jgi:hypothetical protein
MPVLVVQMGHNGRPPAPWSVGTAGEQDFTRNAAAACARLLHGRGGWTVRTIIADPEYPVWGQIGGNPAYYRGDAFVALHCDGSSNPDRDGASFGYRTPEGNALAQAIRAAYRARGWPDNFEPDNYTDNLAGYYGTGLAVGQGNRRAVIFECGFLTNAADRARLLGPDGYDRVALAIGDALGIPTDHQEDDVSWADDLRVLDGTPGYTAGQTIKASVMLADTLAVAHRVEQQNAGLLAAVNTLAAAVANDDDVTADELRAVVHEAMAAVVKVQVSVVDGDPPATG